MREEAKKSQEATDIPTEATNTGTNAPINQDKDCQEIIDKKDYYEILGIAKTADENDIKKAYKKVIHIYKLIILIKFIIIFLKRKNFYFNFYNGKYPYLQ